MEKAVLKTLLYYDIFDFPLKAWEVHKWLIGKQANLKQVEKALNRLNRELRIKNQGGYYFLSNRKGLLKERLIKEEISSGHLKTAKLISVLFKLIPWIKLAGISGSLSISASGKKDDIDLFVITSRNCIWLSRLLLIILATLTGLRRKRREKLLSAAGKICINLILEEDNLAQKNRNIYVAHEVLQMKVLWQKDEVYSKFLHANDWAFKYLPNWKSGIIESQNVKVKRQKYNLKVKSNKLFDWLENLARRFQLKIMDGPSGSERIENGALYFHPEDKGVKILGQYKRKIFNLR